MNIFIIPSWYPSKGNPLNGIFIKEQTIALAKYYPHFNFGISRWGQNDEDFLLYAGKPWSSLRKSLKKHKPWQSQLLPNLCEFFHPAYSFTDKVLKGNIEKKIQANHFNLKQFEARFGKTDIIHAHVYYPGGYIAQRLSKIKKVPYMISEHMGPFPQVYHMKGSSKLRNDIQWAMNEADKITAVSNDLKKVLASYSIKSPIEVIPNFLDIERVKNPQKQESENFKFITVSGMVEGKGIEELIYAVKIATAVDDKLQFLMIGDGPLLSKLKRKTQELELEKHITWKGFVSRENINQCLSLADAHILVGHYDSFGICYIEAMAAGLPNIAAAIGGPLDIITSDTGVLVAEVDPELIAEKILWMKNNYQIYDRENIRKSFLERFSVDAVVPQIKTIYESLSRQSP